jgi:hypothetical protein
MKTMLERSANPSALLENVLASNPKYGNAYRLLKNSASPKQAFFELARQKGVDPNSIISMLK